MPCSLPKRLQNKSEMCDHPKACSRHTPGPGWALGKIYSCSVSKPESGLPGVSSRSTSSKFLPSSFKCLSAVPSFSVFSLNNRKDGSPAYNPNRSLQRSFHYVKKRYIATALLN